MKNLTFSNLQPLGYRYGQNMTHRNNSFRLLRGKPFHDIWSFFSKTSDRIRFACHNVFLKLSSGMKLDNFEIM